MKRIIALFDLEDAALILGLSLFCGGLFMIYPPAALMVAGGLILGPRLLKYVPRGKGR